MTHIHKNMRTMKVEAGSGNIFADLSLPDAEDMLDELRSTANDNLEVLSHRWHAARLLDQGVPYAQVAERVRGSTTTVTRVAHWLRHGEGGYRLVLDRRAKRR